MIDSATQEQVVVRNGGSGGPYIMIPVDQVNVVEVILGNHKVPYWVDSDAISLDGKPAVIVINLGRGADAGRIQRLLDASS